MMEFVRVLSVFFLILGLTASFTIPDKTFQRKIFRNQLRGKPVHQPKGKPVHMDNAPDKCCVPEQVESTVSRMFSWYRSDTGASLDVVSHRLEDIETIAVIHHSINSSHLKFYLVDIVKLNRAIM